MATPPDLARDLRAAGVPVNDLWELVNARVQYKAAIPVLVDWLRNVERRVPGPDRSRVREGLVRALSVPAARPGAALALIEEFRKASDVSETGLGWLSGTRFQSWPMTRCSIRSRHWPKTLATGKRGR
jgi:hypothetical protein